MAAIQKTTSRARPFQVFLRGALDPAADLMVPRMEDSVPPERPFLLFDFFRLPMAISGGCAS